MPGALRCASCGAGAPTPPMAVERAVGYAVPRLRFNWLAVICALVSLGVGYMARLWPDGEEPGLYYVLGLLWIFIALPFLLFRSAIREARAIKTSMIPGIVISLFVWFVAFLLMFVPMGDSNGQAEDKSADRMEEQQQE